MSVLFYVSRSEQRRNTQSVYNKDKMQRGGRRKQSEKIKKGFNRYSDTERIRQKQVQEHHKQLQVSSNCYGKGFVNLQSRLVSPLVGSHCKVLCITFNNESGERMFMVGGSRKRMFIVTLRMGGLSILAGFVVIHNSHKLFFKARVKTQNK